MALNLANDQRRDSYRCKILREDLVRWLPRKKSRCGRLKEFIPTAENVSSKVDTPVHLILTVLAQASLLFGKITLYRSQMCIIGGGWARKKRKESLFRLWQWRQCHARHQRKIFKNRWRYIAFTLPQTAPKILFRWRQKNTLLWIGAKDGKIYFFAEEKGFIHASWKKNFWRMSYGEVLVARPTVLSMVAMD